MSIHKRPQAKDFPLVLNTRFWTADKPRKQGLKKQQAIYVKIIYMENNIYQQAEAFVIDSFNEAGDDHGGKHLLRTVFWIKELKPDADEALLVAAVAHDIERGFRNNKDYSPIKNDDKGFQSEAHLTHHQEEGAKIIGTYLESIGANEEFIARVKMLVLKHEIGGNEDQNLLKDADSISFFENNIDHFLSSKVLETGKDKVKDKFDWMYERISSAKAKQIVKAWYDEAIHRLGF